MTLTEEQRIYLTKVTELKTPKQTDPNRKKDYELCYLYADSRDAANSCLKGYISYESAIKRIDKNLKRAGVDLKKQGRLENAMG